jgi:cytochrome c oxidase subunit II
MIQSPLNPAGPQAATIAALSVVFFTICAAVYVLTIGALLWAIFRRRQQTDDSPRTSRRLATVVAAAGGVTALTLVALTVADAAAQRRVMKPSPPGALTIEAVGHQWWWDFQYQGASPQEFVSSPNELHIPVGVPITIKTSSRDVIHSFWVPNLIGKRDLIPGMTTQMLLQADEAGTYRGQCAEFCGHQHAHMAFLVVAEPMEEFQRWMQRQRSGAPQPATDEQKRGHDVFMAGPCVMCHTIRATSAGARFGPDLTHVASRRTIAAGTLTTSRAHLADWIRDSQAVKPGNRMPPNVVRPEHLDALLAYLETLQ